VVDLNAELVVGDGLLLRSDLPVVDLNAELVVGDGLLLRSDLPLVDLNAELVLRLIPRDAELVVKTCCLRQLYLAGIGIHGYYNPFFVIYYHWMYLSI